MIPKTKKRIRLVAIVLAAALLLLGVAYLATRGDWWFYLKDSMRTYDTPALEQVTLGDGIDWSMDELKRDARTRVTATMMLVNTAHPLPDGYEAELEEYGGALMHPLMVERYVALKNAVYQKTRVKIYVSSDYRTREEQEEILAESEEGIAAQVGCSEHEAGLALDVYAPYFAGEEFLKSPAGREVNRICHEYGFIIRYPRDKEAITGISFEPWHLRYVGEPHAEIMAQSGLTLEEYVEYLVPEVWYQSGEYMILRTKLDTVTMPAAWESCIVSPDNTGYVLITVK